MGPDSLRVEGTPTKLGGFDSFESYDARAVYFSKSYQAGIDIHGAKYPDMKHIVANSIDLKSPAFEKSWVGFATA